MPFTLAHPVAVLPFRKTRMDMTSLVIGSMAPDFDYLFHTQTGTSLSHSLIGIIYYCLPITIGIAWVWHFIVKASLASALPKVLARKYSDWLSNSWEYKSLFRLLIIPVSAVAGILTHLTWDSFTHISGFFVQNIAFLTTVTWLYHLPVFKVLQYGCGILGASMVLYAVVLHSSQQAQGVVHRHPKTFWITFLFILAAFCLNRFLRMPNASSVQLLRYAIVNFLSGSAVSVTIASVVERIYNKLYPFLPGYRRSVY